MPDPSPEAQIIPLDKMPQQAGVRDAKDDWTGVISRKERRKLQNRLNQRRYRMVMHFYCLFLKSYQLTLY